MYFDVVYCYTVRICQNDHDYYSYTEVPLVCRHSSSHLKYNLAQAAYVAKPGSELAKSMGITTEDDLLFVVFSRSREENEDSRPTNNSALCVYSLLNVHRLFTQNIQHCFNGNGNQGLDFINIKQKCVSTVSSNSNLLKTLFSLFFLSLFFMFSYLSRKIFLFFFLLVSIYLGFLLKFTLFLKLNILRLFHPFSVILPLLCTIRLFVVFFVFFLSISLCLN